MSVILKMMKPYITVKNVQFCWQVKALE